MVGGVGITIGFPKVAFTAKDPRTEYSAGFGTQSQKTGFWMQQRLRSGPSRFIPGENSGDCGHGRQRSSGAGGFWAPELTAHAPRQGPSGLSRTCARRATTRGRSLSPCVLPRSGHCGTVAEVAVRRRP